MSVGTVVGVLVDELPVFVASSSGPITASSLRKHQYSVFVKFDIEDNSHMDKTVVSENIRIDDLGVVEVDVIALDVDSDSAVTHGFQDLAILEEGCIGDFLESVGAIGE